MTPLSGVHSGRIARSWTLTVLLAGVAVQACLAGNPPCPTSTYKYLRYDEDYTFLRNDQCRRDPWDRLKFIPLRPHDTWYLSLGGEVRENMEYFENPSWGSEPQGSPYLLQRYMFHADFHPGEHLRFFVQLKSGLENGREGGPRIIDEDKLDLHQASVELLFGEHDGVKTSLRIGRQELALGSRRFVSAREGPNVRQSFDGIRFNLSTKGWASSIFLSRPVQTKTEYFDDVPAPGQTLWGIYTSHPLKSVAGLNLDLYYLGLDRTKARFQQGSGEEVRHSLGGRLWGQQQGWDFDFEPIFQWGSFANGDIRAWSVESETGYTFPVRTTPRIGIRADAASGDSDPKSNGLGTFNPLFPRGLYHQLVNLNGHVNFVGIDPMIVSHIRKDFSLTFDCAFFWRESTDDGVYGVAGNLLRPGSPADGRYVATQPSLVAEWHPDRHITVIGIYTHSFPGDFIVHSGPHGDVNYVSLWISYKF